MHTCIPIVLFSMLLIAFPQEAALPSTTGRAVLYMQPKQVSLKSSNAFVIEIFNSGDRPVHVWHNPRFERRLFEKDTQPTIETKKRVTGNATWKIAIECWTPPGESKYGYIDHSPIDESDVAPEKIVLIKFSIPSHFLYNGKCKIRARIESNSKVRFFSVPIWIECVD